METAAHIYKSPAARVGVFVDAQNIFRSLQALPRRLKIDYRKILNRAVATRTLYCAHFYDIIAEQDFAKDTFLEAIGRHYQVFTKPVQVFADGTKKGDWDLGMAVAMIAVAEKLDVVVLVSGDGDFLPVVQYLKHKCQCRVEGISILRTTNAQLKAAFDYHIDLGSASAADLCR